MPSFLDLPPELRLIIYDLVLPNYGKPDDPLSGMKLWGPYITTHKKDGRLRLSQVCRLMKIEITRHFYDRTTIWMNFEGMWAFHTMQKLSQVFPGFTGEKMLGYYSASDWANACSDEAIRSLRYIKVTFDDRMAYPERMLSYLDRPDIPPWLRTRTGVQNRFDVRPFIIDVKRCTVVDPDNWSDYCHLPVLRTCKASLQEWVDELKGEGKGEGEVKPLTREHLLKLIW